MVASCMSDVTFEVQLATELQWHCYFFTKATGVRGLLLITLICMLKYAFHVHFAFFFCIYIENDIRLIFSGKYKK